MQAEPLYQYLITRNDIRLVSPNTACWRGYYGSWEIINNKLFLVDLKAYIEGYVEVDLNYIFPNHEKVFADWFTGEIIIPLGEMLQYVHLGYESLFEKYLILKLRRGVVVSEKEISSKEWQKEREKEWLKFKYGIYWRIGGIVEKIRNSLKTKGKN